MNGKKKLLWVDDEIEYLRAHILFMEEHGYEVEKATNGDDAIALIKQQHFDLVLLDEQMAGKDGLTTLEEIKEYDSTIPVVMVTKSEEERLMEAALGRNINGYLTKPVNPSQILSVCKSLLHSRAIRNTHITSAYVREYAENKASLMTNLTPSKWEKLYFRLCRWDVDLATIKDQGLEETHKNQVRESTKKFIHYVEENYVQWMGRRAGNPSLCTQSIKRKVIPALQAGEKVCIVVMSGFRLDQWLMVQHILEPYFKVDNAVAWALLPTDAAVCRVALFSGQSPREFALNKPAQWDLMLEAQETGNIEFESALLLQQLANAGLHYDSNELMHMQYSDESKKFLKEIEEHDDKPLISIVVDFMSTLSQLRGENPLMMEIVPNESGFRDLTKIWFESSNLLQILRYYATKNRKVVLTSDHGTILVNSPAEVFCQEEKSPHPRVKMGKEISCDERHALFVESPEHYGLPGKAGEYGYAIAKDQNYFVYPNKFQYFGTKFKDQMVSGGLSLPEVLVPLVTLSAK